MYKTSTAFNAALASSSRTWLTKVEVLRESIVQTELDVVLSGRITLDDTAVRRSAKVNIVDATGRLSPVDAHDLLAPVGTELRIWRGLRLADGSAEYVPLGVVGITEPEVFTGGGGIEVRIDADDRVDAVRARRFASPWRVAGGTPTWEAISDIVLSRITVPLRYADTGHTVPEALFDELSDPWAAVEEIAEADGLTVYFDALGTLVIEPPDECDCNQTYAEGDGSVLIEGSRWMSAEDTYSGVIVTGEHPDEAPVRYVLWDTDPASATYADGPFGYRPFGFASPLVSSAAKAQAAAETIFARVTGMRQRAELTTIGHPGHEIGDIVFVDHDSCRTRGRYAVTGASIPLRAGETMRLTLREALDGT
jgi:Domain of unknown function (DUF5047)